MSKQEQDEIGRDLLWGYQQKKKTLCCLESKAESLAGVLENRAKMLRQVPDFEEPPEHQPFFDPLWKEQPEAADLISKIWRHRKELSEMKNRLTRMGVPFPIS